MLYDYIHKLKAKLIVRDHEQCDNRISEGLTFTKKRLVVEAS